MSCDLSSGFGLVLRVVQIHGSVTDTVTKHAITPRVILTFRIVSTAREPLQQASIVSL